MKFLDVKTDFVPNNIDKEIKTVLDIANEANLTNEELELQRKRKEFIYIQKSSIELAKEKEYEKGFQEGYKIGYEKGREEGFQKGKAEGIELGEANMQKNIVLNAHKKGMTEQEISNITGISEALILRIIDQN